MVFELVFFCFECIGNHRDLHSFPTRRSSDLSRPGCTCCRLPDNRAWSGRRPPLVQDRKSTRLNSSHPSISYAVFCLKKKSLPPAPSVVRHGYRRITSRDVPHSSSLASQDCHA